MPSMTPAETVVRASSLLALTEYPGVFNADEARVIREYHRHVLRWYWLRQMGICGEKEFLLADEPDFAANALVDNVDKIIGRKWEDPYA